MKVVHFYQTIVYLESLEPYRVQESLSWLPLANCLTSNSIREATPALDYSETPGTASPTLGIPFTQLQDTDTVAANLVMLLHCINFILGLSTAIPGKDISMLWTKTRIQPAHKAWGREIAMQTCNFRMQDREKCICRRKRQTFHLVRFTAIMLCLNKTQWLTTCHVIILSEKNK